MSWKKGVMLTPVSEKSKLERSEKRVDLGHAIHIGSSPCPGHKPIRTPSLMGFCFFSVGGLDLFLTPNGHNMDSRYKGLFSYENKLKKEYLLTSTNETKVHLDSTGIPLIKKNKKQNTVRKEDDCLENKMAVTRVWNFVEIPLMR